jgi:hypothetical protein
MPYTYQNNIALTTSLNLRSQDGSQDKFENRPDQYGFMNPPIDDTVNNRFGDFGVTRTNLKPGAIISQTFADDLQSAQAIKSNNVGGESRVESLVVDKRVKVDTGGITTCAIPTQDGPTTSYIGYQYYRAGFDVVYNPTDFFDNDYELDRFLAREFDSGCQALANVVSQVCQSEFIANQNSYWPTATESPLNFYPQVGNVLQVPALDAENMYNNIEGIFQAMNFPSSNNAPYRIIHGSRAAADIRRWANQGQANAENYTYQFRPGLYDFQFTNIQIPTKPGVDYTLYAQAADTNFILPYVEGQYYQGSDMERTSNSTGKFWTTLEGSNVPYLGMPLAVIIDDDCQETGQGGIGQLKAIRYQLMFWIGSTYNSDDAGSYSPKIQIDKLS